MKCELAEKALYYLFCYLNDSFNSFKMTVFQIENIQSKPMNSYYELTYIISPVLEDEQYPAVIQRINDLITSSGGAIEEVRMGPSQICLRNGQETNRFLCKPIL